VKTLAERAADQIARLGAIEHAHAIGRHAEVERILAGVDRVELIAIIAELRVAALARRGTLA
jgi:hypothetical protein